MGTDETLGTLRVTADLRARAVLVDDSLQPNASDGAALGSVALPWSDLFLAPGAVLNFGNGNARITHSDALLTFTSTSISAVGIVGQTVDIAVVLRPQVDDGAPLGSTVLKWSDLFLAAGAVINFNAGNVTLTHSAGLLTLAGGGLAASGLISSSSPTAGIGYATGAGGAVTQLTNKTTGVTLNTICGTITMEATGSIAADTSVAFTLTDSAIAANDVVVVTHSSGGTLGAYCFAVTPAAGSAVINVHNTTPGALSEAIVLRFAVIKAVVA